jgi:hypothetical protein
MGLTISYRMKVHIETDGSRRLVAAMRDFALAQGFEAVTPVYEEDPPDGRYEFERAEERPADLKTGSIYLPRRRADGLDELVHVPSLHAVAFLAAVPGAEPAEFGLASHPPVVAHREDVVSWPDGIEERRVGAGARVEFATDLDGWYSWYAFSKTQFAADPKLGGAENFLRAHLAITGVLDECRRLGIEVNVTDESGYWEHRDREALLRELARWNELIAAFTGRMTDELAKRGVSTESAMKGRADFEHLEARGAKRLEEMGWTEEQWRAARRAMEF